MELGSKFTTSDQAYGLVAAEYYDARIHPTCANFREASQRFLEGIGARRRDLFDGRLLEVGAGDSVAADVMHALDLDGLDRLVLSDVNWDMLQYSKHWANAGASLVIASGTKLPFRQSSFDLLISSLGDPYNTPTFWSEASRVLKQSGHVVFTTPAYEWSTRYRNKTTSPSDEARFVLRSGESVGMPSYVRPKQELQDLASSVGLRLREYRLVLASELSGPLSEKLLCSADAEKPVLEGYLFGR